MEKSYIRNIVFQAFDEIRQLFITLRLFTIVPHLLELIYNSPSELLE
ncbi:hypothetical protein M3231_04910 [Neobacillus mesonae]|nr:hypothetical protein [Neobacillus mesonae]